MIAKEILVAFAIVIAFLGCRSGENLTVPDDLVGVWETAESKYRDRFMEFKKDVVIFGTGEGNQSVHPIRKVRAVRQDGRDLYTVYYLSQERGEYSFSFFYNPEGGVITLKNQNEIAWKKNS